MNEAYVNSRTSRNLLLFGALNSKNKNKKEFILQIPEVSRMFHRTLLIAGVSKMSVTLIFQQFFERLSPIIGYWSGDNLKMFLNYVVNY